MNSLPKVALENLDNYSEGNNKLPNVKPILEKHHWFRAYDDYLDQALCGKAHLKNERIADMVAEAIHYRDNKVYSLDAFCIMPNHVHLVCMPLEKEKDCFHSLTEILHSLKRHSARQANLILGRTGTFWQDESYDHIVRDQNELERIIAYVLSNPVKAGLVEDWTQWKWSYCKHDLQDEIVSRPTYPS
jgi:putative transposase